MPLPTTCFQTALPAPTFPSTFVSRTTQGPPRQCAVPQPRCRPPTSTAAPPKPTPTPSPPKLPPPTAPLPRHGRPPLLGLLLDIIRGHNNGPALAAKYGPLYHSDYIGSRVLRVADLDLINTVLRDTQFTAVDAYPSFFKQLIAPNSLIFLDGEEHRAIRTAIGPAFVAALLPRHAEIARKSFRTVFDALEPGADVADAISEHIFRVVLEAFCFSRPPAGDDGATGFSYGELCDDFSVLLNGFAALPRTPRFRNALAARDRLIARFSAVARERIEAPDYGAMLRELRNAPPPSGAANGSGDGPGSSLLAKLVRAGKVDMMSIMLLRFMAPDGSISEGNLREAAFSLLSIWVAGTTTQIGTLISSIKELGSDPTLYARLRAEQDEAVVAEAEAEAEAEATSSADEADGRPQLAPVAPALDGLIGEMLRLHPPVNMLPRVAACDTTLGGHAVASGTKVALDVSAALMDPARFVDPMGIDVDRYARDEASVTAVSLAFGGRVSRHYCMGAMVAKTTIAASLETLLREYEFKLKERTSGEYVAMPEVRPKDGVVLKSITRRE